MAWKNPLVAIPLSFLAGLAATALPAPAAEVTSGRVPVEGGSLYFESAGEGPVVVLVHDGLVASVSWKPALERLAPYCHAVAYDRRGCGKSDPAPEKYSDVSDLDAVVRSTGARAVAIAGCSYGGQLTIDYALEHPERVSALVLVGPVVSGMPQAGHFLERNSRNFAPWSVSGDLDASIESWINDPYLIAPADAAGRARFAEMLRADPWAIRGTIHPTPPEKPALPRLGTLRLPALIVTGESDIPEVHAHCGAIEAGLPASRRVVLPGAGH